MRPQFQDVSQYYVERQQTSAPAEDTIYWARLLRDYVPTNLVNFNGETKTAGSLQSYRTCSSVNPGQLSKQARNFAINPQVFFQAAVGYVLSLYAGSSDVIFGNVTSGRTIPVTGIEDIFDELEFKLTLEFEPRDDFISFRATYDPTMMPQEQVIHLARQIDEVVQIFLSDSSCAVADIGRCFTPASLSIANADYRHSNDNVGLSHAVETWANEIPNKEAIIFGHFYDGAMRVKNTLTYSNLNQQANQMAHLLAKHGLGQDHLVCIMMEKSVDLYVAILAVLKLGSGYLPLVPDTPVERVNAILKDAKVMVCISDSDTAPVLQQVFSGTIIDLSATDLSALPRHNLDTPYNGSHIAYTVFTSGSTGTPKGVLVTQKNLMSNLKFLAGLYPASKESRMLQSCSQAFDVSVFEIFYAWHVGMALCTATKEDMFRDFEESINTLGATHLSLTPTVAALVDPDNVPKVKFLVTAGEALTEHVRRQWANRGLYQGYGPSETTNICTVRPSVTSADLINNIGPPFDNTSAFVLNPDNNMILPRGAVGELCFGGEQVFRGYLNRPELNATKLIEIAPYGTIYRSGDMGRLLPNDCILSAGRSDDQIKIRGQRVELGEITSIVLDDSAVTDCVTLLLSTENRVQILVTFWVPQNAKDEQFATLEAKAFESTVHRIFASLQRHLPVYMVPSFLVPISNLPMTAQAKIDKRLLHSTFISLSDDDLSRTAPTLTDEGKTICDGNGATTSISAWRKDIAEALAKVLGIRATAIRQTSSFFNLGLDSVSAIRFCQDLRRSDLGDFTVAEVLKNPSIAYLDALRANREASGAAHTSPLGKLSTVFSEEQQSQIQSTLSATGFEVEKINPCTPLQEAMLASSASSEVAYSNTLIFNITGDISRLQTCWELAQSRHEILRTAFTSSEHPNFAFAQVVLKDPNLRWDHLETLDGVRSYMESVLSDLLVSHKPPLCLATYKADSSIKLIFSCHHALYDGIAIDNLLAEIQLIYSKETLPAAISYDHYLQHVISQDAGEADKFWSHRFTNFKPTSNVDSLDHQLTALRRIQHVALKEGDRLFDTLVILQQPSKPLDDSIWTLEEDMGEMDLPVVCEVHQDEQQDHLKLTLHYNTNLMSGEDARVVAQTFDSNLQALTHHHDAAANDPATLPRSLKAESNTSSRQVQPDTVPLCNSIGTDVAILDLLHKAFEQNARSRQRDNIALDFLRADGQRTYWSYYELNLIANRIAYRLMDRGIGPEDIVPIHMPKSPMFYASILGVLKAGAAFAPIHPDLPEARRKLMLQELNPKAILCTDSPSEYAAQISTILLSVADLEKPKWESCETPHIKNLTGSNLAYCLYTSGSTGVPKAVSMEHRSPIQTIESSRSLVPWNASSRLLQYAAITFDMCYYDCFMAWTFGFTLCAADQHVMFDNLSHVVNTLDVTLLDLTPSVAVSLSRAEVPSVQWLYCIGEAMSGEVAKEWSGACVNSYGPTEAAFCTTMFPVSQDIKTSIIGQPYPSTSFAVFSAHGEQSLPMLSVGELCIGGAQLARGYLGRPELTAERFVTRCGQRMYKTGDMVRMLTDGNFEFIGRADDQVKIRGLRVELGEISQVLQSCDTRIRSALVQILKKDAGSKEQLVAFLVTDSTFEECDQSDLRRKAMQAAKINLPDYMVPRFYLFIDGIPKSMAGKIDKKSLSEVFRSSTATHGISKEANNDHQWTRIETDIREVLSRLSRTPVDEVLPETSIYQLGLDSISAVQISAALQKLGYEANASDILRFNTCVDLAQYFEKGSQTASPSIEFDFDGFEKKHRGAILKSCGLDSQSVDAIRMDRCKPDPPLVLARASSISSTEIEEGCRAANTTLQAVGIASWSAILAAYTGEPTVTIGVVLSGRLSEAANNAVIPCINTVPFPCIVTNHRREDLSSVTVLNAEMHQHQFMPLNKIQRLMGSPNEPLFDSLFALQRATGRIKENKLWTIVEESATTEYPISLELELRQKTLEYRLTYLPHIIPPEQAEMILVQLDHIMKEHLTANSASDHEPVLNQALYSITPAKEPSLPSKAKLLNEFVEFTANTHPLRAAFEFASSIHDGQLGGLVGVCFDKCPEASFAMLGILKAGCAFVAIDPSAPSARQAFVVEDSGAQLVLSMTAQSAKFNGDIQVSVLNLDDITTDEFPSSRPQLSRAIDSQDRSYCLYTSGTTGTPKGCELTHENAVQALLAFQRLFHGHWDECSRWLQFASFHFDVSVLEQYWSWSVGICVVSAPRDLIFEDLANSIRALNITHIDLTPSLAQILHPDDVPSLCKGVFITGGESLKQEILDVWGPRSVIYNGYGPTEATIGCTMYPRVPANGKPSNIGPQFDNVGSYVLQPGTDIPVLRGGVGELCVSGKLVGKGYLNRPELTKERFAYLRHFDERVYRTGDLVRILHNGTFDFLGRADDQVKLRGQRLEIGEINSVIRQSRPDFTDVATLVLKHPQQQKEQLVSFVVIGNRSPHAVSVLPFEGVRLSEAKEACHDKLPPYMIPTHFIPLPSMPLNINNKADKKQLKQIYESLGNSDLQKLSTAPGETQSWTKQEERLRCVLAQALHISDGSIEKDSSFYELGMDSISVIGVSQALKDAGFATVSAATVLKHASIGRLAKALYSPDTVARHNGSLISAQQAISAAKHRYRGAVTQALAADPQDVEALAPCTPLQQGMIARYLDSDHGLYFNAFTFELDQTVDIRRLREAWSDVYNNTQILRTTFVNTDGGYVQAVLRGTALPWHEQNATPVSKAIYVHEARQRWLAANCAEPRNPFELHVISTPEQRTLVVQIFHGLYDGNSIELLFEAVRRAYENEAVDVGDVPTFHEALPYGPLRIVEGAQKFWQNHLTGRVSRRFPPLSGRSAQGTVVVTRDLEPNEVYDLVRKKLKVTAQAIAQACWMHVIQEYVGLPITTGVVVSGRHIEMKHADQVIGPMFNTIPYSQRGQSDDTWASLILRAHEFNTAALQHHHTPLRDIMKWCKISHDQPLFDTLFVYQVSHAEGTQWSANNLWTLRDGGAVADYPLAIEIGQKSHGRFTLTLVTEGQVATEKTSNRLLDRFEETLTNALADPATVVETSITVGESNTEDLAGVNNIANGMSSLENFHWTDEAIATREEIASLTNVEVESVLETTSIFELGLDSIDAIKLSSRLKRRGVNLPVSGIMRGLTVQGMVNNIDTIHFSGVVSPTEDVFADQKRNLTHYVESQSMDLSKVDNVLPLTPLQEAMVAEMKASDYTRYFNFDVAEVAANTDIDRLCKAWRTVIASTPILRTAFMEVDDPKLSAAFAQIVLKDGFPEAVERQQHDSNRHPDFFAIFERLRRRAVHSKAPEPPIKITYVETPERTFQILSIAHALYDGWSLALLHDAVKDAYIGRCDQAPDYEPTLNRIVTESGSKAADFWKEYLTDAKPSMFARRDESLVAPGTVHRKEMASRTHVSDITAFAKSSKVSLQILGQSVFAVVLASYVGSLDVIFGCVLSGRDDVERSQILFPVMNTVAIRTVVHGSRQQLLQYAQDSFNDIKQWQNYPLRKASALVGSQGQLFDSLFIYQKRAKPNISSEEKLYISVEGQSDVEYPVCVEMEVVDNTLIWRCAVKDEVLDQKGARMLLNTLDAVLHSIMQCPESPTIESTQEGTSVCGLPAFNEKSMDSHDSSLTAQGTTHSADIPLSETSLQIRKALASIAQVPESDIDRDMSIFHIGLDSISAIKVSSALRKQGVTLSVGEMLRAGTVAKMGEVVDERTKFATNGTDDTDAAIERALHGLDRDQVLQQAGVEASEVDCVLPCTAGQLYMLSLWLNTKGANFYPKFVFNLTGRTSFEVLQTSWQDLVAANSILRTQIIATGGTNRSYIQVVLKEANASLTNITDQDDATTAHTITTVAKQQPWAHLFAMRIDSGWKITFKIHHALYDGVSLPLLMQQLQSRCKGSVPSSPTSAFNDYIAIAHTASASSQRQAFWTSYLSGLSGHPAARTNPRKDDSKTEIFRPGLLEVVNLEQIARRNGISMHALFLATYIRLCAKRQSQEDVQDTGVLGVYLANRGLPIENLESEPCPTVNLLPLRTEASPSPSSSTPLVDIAKRVQDDLRKLSEPVIATSSLAEIAAWTGVRVDAFVNFLTLPIPTDDYYSRSSVEDDRGVRIERQDGWTEAVSRVAAVEGADEDATMIMEALRVKHVNEAYLHAVDVEATVRDGKLDVGIFAPTSMMSLEEGERLIEELRIELEGLSKE
ncbi:nrps [Didymella heteroderae]|uniref:Nrps n=1 Tax=Didymella heteroderae TaxID=1769908 RepID=A0A9P4WM25_9PLEO|nr:nrps [Didymella heteroderae]